MKKYLLILSFLLVGIGAQSQVLITLLLGDKLNSDGLEFGLEGGLNWSQITNMETKNFARKWNLGFYFDIRMKNQWFLYTGVLVKANLGVDNLTDNDLQFLDADIHYTATDPDSRIPGVYSQKMNYFLVPAMIKYKFKNRMFVSGGVQFGLNYKAWIEFESDVEGFETTIKEFNTDALNRIDVGGIIGLGYQLRKSPGISFAVKYYEGFANVYKGVPGRRNRSFFIAITMPIGRGEAAQQKQSKRETEKKNKKSKSESD